ncbi:MAG TPA: 4Fe-4S binding protein [Thermoanaerobaculaceae bacterium]|nr:4Fe-4S binding protein [Thermoanaerobaculaceae bacterium]HRS14694.1 4Fe-4S binding protein [Thermoanaerobaculaceae bacterium]
MCTGVPLRVRTRRLAQALFGVLVLAIGIQFTLWASAHLAGRHPAVARPAGVEGFLPISALMSLRLWAAGGGIHPIHPAALAILLAAFASSLVLPRAFCSHICPVGTLSELLGDVGRGLLGRTWMLPRWLDIPLRGLKYALLAFFVWATWAAMELPALVAFLDSPYNRVADVKMLLFFAEPSRLTIGVVGALVVASVLVRDAWCRYLCPYGALLGLLGRLAPLRVERDAATCVDCRACTKACPARIPVHAASRVGNVECSGCQDCVAACPVAGCLGVRPPRHGRGALRPALAALAVAGVFLAVLAGFRLAGHWQSSVTEAEAAARLRNIRSAEYGHPGASRSPVQERGKRDDATGTTRAGRRQSE